MLVVEPPPTAAAAARFSARRFDHSPSCLTRSATFLIPRSTSRRGGCRNGIRASSSSKEQSSSSSEPVKPNAKPQRYHPFEEIANSELSFDENGDATLTPAETTRTLIEVNSKATLMFSTLVNEQVHENIFWPDLPYVTDEHGNIYFRVKNDEDILQTLSSEENLVQVIIGLDTGEMMSEVGSLGHADIAFGIDDDDSSDVDVDDEDDDDDDDDEDEDDNGYEKDWVAIIDNEEDEDSDSDSDESVGDWAKLETMRNAHPMYFARKISEAASDDPIDFMDQPPAGLAIQGLLRPAFVEEHTVIQKQMSDNQSNDDNTDEIVKLESHNEDDDIQINGHKHESGSTQEGLNWEELESEKTLENGTSFYKLEMVKIQLISAHGHETFVEIEDFRRAQPDAIAHSASKIISRIKAGGEKTTQALKSLCWRCKGIQVEDLALIGVDSLGFDLRVCSGAQVQTLRFAFNKRASSEYSAERLLNYMLFPRANQKPQQKKEAQQQTEL